MMKSLEKLLDGCVLTNICRVNNPIFIVLKMIARPAIVILILVNCSNNLFSQSLLRGKIYRAATDVVADDVNVFNLDEKLSSRSDSSGSYSIKAKEGDKIVFSAVGFNSDTITVRYDMLLVSYDVSLAKKVISLKPVIVTNSYKADSVARRNYYQDIYAKQSGITGFNRPENGVGIVLSPLSYFSATSRQKRQLKKRLIEQEHDYFIDYSFPAEWVEQLTGLHGDSLRLFMYKYRPSYSFCKKTNRQGMLLYVNEKIKEFRKPH